MRQLRLECYVGNPNSLPVCILDAWISVSTDRGQVIAEGRHYLRRLPSAKPTALAPKEEEYGEIVLPMSDKVLQYIEDTRAGRDLVLKLSSEVFVAYVIDRQGEVILGPPCRSAFTRGNFGSFEYKIPQSEWIDLLRSMEWSELEVLEMPVAKMRNLPELSRALQLFDEARECFRRGDWDSTMADCRKVFEAMVKDVTGSDDLKQAGEAFRKLITAEAKADTLNRTVKEFTNFLHLGRHEALPRIPIKPADARLALHFTGSFLAFLGGP